MVKAKKIALNFTYTFVILFLLFGRTFSGLDIFGLRIAEYIVGFLLTSSTIFLLLKNKLIDKYLDLSVKANVIFKLLILAFIFNFIVNNSQITNLYVFRTSSYIWSLFLIYFFTFILDNKPPSQFFLISVSLAFIYVYVLSTIHFPAFLQEFFLSYSDKFDFLKGSDLLLSYVFVNYINKKYYSNSDHAFYYFILITGLYLPLFLYMSKGSLIPAILYAIVELYLQRKRINAKKIQTIVFIFASAVLFVFSTFQVEGVTGDTIDSAIQSDESFSTTFQDAFVKQLEKNIENKNTAESLFSFYFIDSRIYSTDLPLNWRLQIWQDVWIDLIEKGRLLIGYGNNSVIPAMDIDWRTGMDKLNENVHNFLVNILARGGLVQVFLFLLFFYYTISDQIKYSNSFEILHFVVPVILTSLFDASMESVRFPFIFYFGLSILFSSKKA